MDWAVEMLCYRLSTVAHEIPASMRAPFIRIIKLPEWLYTSNESMVEFAKYFPKTLMLDYKVNCDVTVFDKQPWLRISANIYNTKEDYTRLCDAILEYNAYSNSYLSK